GREVIRQQAFPEELETSVVADAANSIVDWSQDNLRGATSAMSDATIIYGLDPMETLFVQEPWWIIAGVFALIAWRFSGVRLAVSVFACFLLLGMLGMWTFSMATLALVLISVAVTIAV